MRSGGHHRAGAVAEQAEPHAENKAADKGGTNRAGLGMQLRKAVLPQQMHANHAGEHGREHDFHHGEILKEQLVYDYVKVRHPAALQGKAEAYADGKADDKLNAFYWYEF